MIISKLMRLKEQVEKATARVGKSEGRPIPLFWEREFNWTFPGSLPEEQIAYMGNYAPGEVRLHAIGASVQLTWEYSSGQFSKDFMIPTDRGYKSGITPNVTFDFEWNLGYNSSNMQYAVSGNTDRSPFLSSNIFRGEAAGNRLDISPLRLGLNESLELRFRPIYGEESTGVSAAFRTRFYFWGTRSYA